MNNNILKSLTNAHAWIGLIISIVLFIVFFAGAISLFKDNILAWEKLPAYHQKNMPVNVIDADYDKAIEQISNSYDVYVDHLFYLYPPSEHSPFIEAYFAKNIDGLDPVTGEDHTDVYLTLDPTTGEILGEAGKFNYGNFVYQLHYNLGLGRAGLYFVGLITLFFFVAVLSGLVIHWRKLFKNFFQYRKEGNKNKWLDAHNLIGTMGLPFHVMYAFTGLVFNLLIIYQISYALILYQGDQDKLLTAAGANQPHLELTNIATPVTGINELKQIAMQKMGGIEPERIAIDHFGDENAVAIFSGSRKDKFATNAEVHYRIKDREEVYVTLDNYDNAVRSGLTIIARLHFGDFAGYGLRIVFFLMGLATCYVILTGNLLWIEKRAKQRNQNQRSLNFVRRMTSGGFIGVILAIAVGFIAVRIIPNNVLMRADLIENIVYFVFITNLVAAQLIANQLRFSHIMLKVCGVCFVLAVILDWVLIPKAAIAMMHTSYFDLVITETMLLTLSGICFFASKQVIKKYQIRALEKQYAEANLTTSATS